MHPNPWLEKTHLMHVHVVSNHTVEKQDNRKFVIKLHAGAIVLGW